MPAHNRVVPTLSERRTELASILAERLWRTVKYEEVYLHHYEDMEQAWEGLVRPLCQRGTSQPVTIAF